MFGGPVCAARFSNCPLDRVLTLIYLLNLQFYLFINSIQEKFTILPVSAVIPPLDGWIQHSVPHGKLLYRNKSENFNYLNVAFISYKLTVWY